MANIPQENFVKAITQNNQITDTNAINGFFIKYNRLSIMNRIFQQSEWHNCDTIDIYIDMNSITKELFYNRPPVNGKEEITSTIINLCGHYREYYRRYHQCRTKFYIIYSINRPTCCSAAFDEYNSRTILEQMSKPVIYDMIMGSCSHLEALCPYLPDIFFIYSAYETNVAIFDSIEFREKHPWPALILSKDAMMYQILPFSKRAILMRPVKHRKESEKGSMLFDDSVFITSMETIPAVVKYVMKCKYEPIYNSISPALLSMIYTLHGLDKRNVPMLLNTKETFDVIYHGLEWNFIDNRYYPNPDEVYDLLSIEKFGVGKKEIHDRFIALDMLTQHNIMQNEISLGVDDYANHIINLQDPDKVKYENATTFAKCPIILDNL